MSSELYQGFISKLRKSGLSKTNNFYVKVDVSPPNIPYVQTNANNQLPSDEGSRIGENFSAERLRSISFMCTDVSLPKEEIATTNYTVKGGVNQKIASHQLYEQTLPLSFYTTPDLSERRFFENWMNWVIDPTTKNPNYYDEYAKGNMITVFVLPKTFSARMVQKTWIDKIPSRGVFGSVDQNNPFSESMNQQQNSPAALGSENPFYYVEFYECYPTSISSTKLSSESGEVMKVDVEIAYKYYKTITDEMFPKIYGSVDGSITPANEIQQGVNYNDRQQV